MIMKRINRILLLARCLARAIFYGRADTIPSNPSRIIVAPSGKLGDVVCNTPVLFAIRKHLPKAHIIVAGNSKLHHPLLSDSGLVDDYLDLEEDRAIARIKNSHADVALLTGPSFQHVSLFYLAEVPLVIAPTAVGGVAHDVTRPYKILQKFIKVFPHQVWGYAPRERLKALEPLGINSHDMTKHLGFSEVAEKKATDLISNISVSYKYIVGISAGAGGKEKQWDPKKFAEVANYLRKKHSAHVIVFGGKDNIPESTEMMSAILDKSRMTDSTCISIDDLKARISKLDVFISANTGPLYIAEAFNIPTVDILGPVNPLSQSPQGEIHKRVFPPGKPKPLISTMNVRNHDVREAERIAKSTRVEDVITAVEEALQEVDKIKEKG
jgi:heptosyltransferase II